MNSTSELFVDFEWDVAPAYAWKDWLNPNGRPITVRAKGLSSLESCTAVELAVTRAAEEQRETGPVLGPSDGIARLYRPMDREHAGLFRTFAALDYRDREAIRAFASTYGLLGLPQQVQHVPARRTRAEHTAVGESHLAWAQEICLMKEAVRTAATPETHPPLRERNQHRLDWLFQRQLQYVRPRVTFDSTEWPRFSVVPLTLLAAMWLQLSRALTGGKRYVPCKFCQRFLELSTEQSGYRSHREFCSDSCKTNDYRRRKRTALQMAARGLSLAVIANRVDTKVATVRSWLAEQRPSAARTRARG